LVVISESLSLIKNNQSAENLSRQLLEIALKGKLEEKQLLRVAYTLKKIGDDKAVVSFVEQTMHQYPNLQHNSFLLDQKGRALIDLAKRCEQSYHEQQNFRLKNKAKDDFERYLREAQKVLNLAYEYSENVVDKDYIQKALWYIENEMMPFLTGKKKSNIDARTLFIKHIPSKSVKKDIEAIYSKYGAIEKITMNIKTGYDSQVAYIIFETENGAEAAFLDRYNIRLNGEKIHTNRYVR
jgi:hypothetical protein